MMPCVLRSPTRAVTRSHCFPTTDEISQQHLDTQLHPGCAAINAIIDSFIEDTLTMSSELVCVVLDFLSSQLLLVTGRSVTPE